MAGATGYVVEDGPESVGRRKAPLELAVPACEGGQLVSREARKRCIEHFAVWRN
jgi:hypothetical protein